MTSGSGCWSRRFSLLRFVSPPISRPILLRPRTVSRPSAEKKVQFSPAGTPHLMPSPAQMVRGWRIRGSGILCQRWQQGTPPTLRIHACGIKSCSVGELCAAQAVLNLGTGATGLRDNRRSPERKRARARPCSGRAYCREKCVVRDLLCYSLSCNVVGARQMECSDGGRRDRCVSLASRHRTL
ncbi:hypothetical protein VUR80DRAFT_5277 [Thermomyces stellatus]